MGRLWCCLVTVLLLVGSGVGRGQGGPSPDWFGGSGPGGQRTPVREGRGRGEVELPQGTAILRGQVVAADTGTPIRRALVRISSPAARGTRLATTDGQGRFEIRELAAGRYTLSASKGGFVTLQYGQRRPGESGTPLEVADGQVVDRLMVGLPRGSVIAGRISDEFGEPVVNASVIAMRYAYLNGGRRLQPAGARDTTDDQGQYRLFGLPPGDYVVSATLRTSERTDTLDEPSGYAPTYYPGTPDASDAQRIRLALQQEDNTISFGLIATRLVRVSGMVVSATGGPVPGGAVILASVGGAAEPGATTYGGAIDSGAFRIANVAPGRYLLQTRTGSRDQLEFARMDLVVGAEDVAGLTLVTAPAARLNGVVITDTNSELPTANPGLQVTARPASPDAVVPAGPGRGNGQMRVGADGWFEFANVMEPRLIRVSTPPGWMLQSVRLNGQDVTDAPIEVMPGQTVSGLLVTLTQRVAAISGSVYDSRRQPVIDATVVLFPADAALRGYQSRYIRVTRPNQQGTYTLGSLPAGDYLAVAVQGLEDGGANDPAFLETLEPQATRVSVKTGETKTLMLERRDK